MIGSAHFYSTPPPPHATITAQEQDPGQVDEFRVFLSAVTSEFGQARDALAKDLGARQTLVRVQDSFRSEATADTLLRLLHDYVRDCAAVVCVLGARSGACPPPAAAAEFAAILPPGITEASYTQWEFFFARHHKRRLSLYRAGADYAPDRDTPGDADRPDLQAAFLRHIDDAGLYWIPFSSRHELRAEVLKEDWPREKPPKPILLPYPSLGDLFVGRGDALVRLRASLQRSSGAAITSSAVLGLGGIGKTRLAVEYAWAHQDHYAALLFVLAETPEALPRNLAALTGLLGMHALNSADDETRLNAVLDWLGRNPNWLLILDNVDSREAAEAVTALMGRLTHGHVLLTGRLSRFPPEFAPLELGLLAPDDAARFLLDRTEGHRRATPDDAAEAAALAQDLGWLALALEQAGAYVAAEPLPMTLADYRARLRDSFAEVMDWSDPLVTHYPRAVAATWQTSVARLDGDARALLERLAFLAPDPVPAFLLDVDAPGAGAGEARRGLRGLAAYSLVVAADDGSGFTVHRLVQDVTRRGLEQAGTARERLVEALGWVNAAFTGDAQDVRSWLRLDPLVPHAEAVVAHADAAGIADPTGRLMGALGTLFQAKALYGRSEPLKRRALAIGEASLGNDHPDVATRLNNLAQLLKATNQLGEAEPLMRRALAIGEASLGKDHPDVATRLNNLAQLLQATNRLGEAEPLMRRALAIDEASAGKDHPKVARDLNNLAQLLQATNRLGEAEPLMRRALAIDEASLGKDHPDVAIDLSNLAQLLQATNRLGEAEPLMRRALAIDEASLGKDHPDVARDLNNLAQLLQATNRLGEAEPLMRRALAIDEASLGKDHPDVAIDLSNLAQLLQATSRLGEAEPLMRRALVSALAFQRDTGHVHPRRDARTANYTDLLTAMGRSKEEIDAAIAGLWREAGLDRA